MRTRAVKPTLIYTGCALRSLILSLPGAGQTRSAPKDPAKPTRTLPLYDSGDSLHPGDAGYMAIGEAIDLTLFRRRR